MALAGLRCVAEPEAESSDAWFFFPFFDDI